MIPVIRSACPWVDVVRCSRIVIEDVVGEKGVAGLCVFVWAW